MLQTIRKSKSKPRAFNRKSPQLVYQKDKPVAVILSIEHYENMLERLEEQEDIRILKEMRKKPMSFKSLEMYLQERSSCV